MRADAASLRRTELVVAQQRLFPVVPGLAQVVRCAIAAGDAVVRGGLAVHAADLDREAKSRGVLRLRVGRPGHGQEDLPDEVERRDLAVPVADLGAEHSGALRVVEGLA